SDVGRDDGRLDGLLLRHAGEVVAALVCAMPRNANVRRPARGARWQEATGLAPLVILPRQTYTNHSSFASKVWSTGRLLWITASSSAAPANTTFATSISSCLAIG